MPTEQTPTKVETPMPKVVIAPAPVQETRTIPEVATPLKSALDWTKAKAHLEKYKTHILSFAGKVDHNPYIWLAQTQFYILENELEQANDPSVYEKIMALNLEDTPHVSKLKV